MSYDILQSSTQAALLFLMVSSTDHVSPGTGLTCTVTLSKNGGAFAAPAGAVTEIANGWYKVAGNATDTNTLGPLALHATATGADASDLVVANIVAFNPQDAVRQGLTALPNVASGSAGAIPTTGTGANQLNVSGGRADANAASVAGYVFTTGTAQNGTSTTITLASGTSNLQCYPGDVILILTGTAAGSSGYVASFDTTVPTAPVATMQGSWGISNPSNTSTYVILKVGGVVPATPSDVLAAFPKDGAGFIKSNVMGVNAEPFTGSTKPYTVAT